MEAGSHPRGLLALPDHLLECVALCLSFKDRLRLAATSASLRRFLGSHLQLTSTVELRSLGPASLPSFLLWLRRQPQLRHLWVGASSGWPTSGFGALRGGLSSLHALRALCLDTRGRSWSFWLDCGEWLVGLRSLAQLRVSLADSCTLTTHLARLSTLTALCISHRQRYDVEAPRAALLRLAEGCFPPSLQLLHLDNFLLEPVSGLSQLSALSSLEELRLASVLSQMGTPPDLQALSALTTLTALALEDLEVRSSALQALPRLTRLRRLQLAQCLTLGGDALHGALGPGAPAAWPHLTSLDLHGNLLEEVPPRVVLLTQLRELALHNNLLSGDLPLQMTRLSRLERLSCCDLDLYNTADVLGPLRALSAVWIASDHAGFQLPSQRQMARILRTLRTLPSLSELYCTSPPMRLLLDAWRGDAPTPGAACTSEEWALMGGPEAHPPSTPEEGGGSGGSREQAGGLLGGLEAQHPTTPVSPISGEHGCSSSSSSSREREWVRSVWRKPAQEWPYGRWPLPPWDAVCS